MRSVYYNRSGQTSFFSKQSTSDLLLNELILFSRELILCEIGVNCVQFADKQKKIHILFKENEKCNVFYDCFSTQFPDDKIKRKEKESSFFCVEIDSNFLKKIPKKRAAQLENIENWDITPNQLVILKKGINGTTNPDLYMQAIDKKIKESSRTITSSVINLRTLDTEVREELCMSPPYSLVSLR